MPTVPPDPPQSQPPVGLIAAGGRLPLAAAEGIRAAGRSVACVGLRDHFDPHLPDACDRFKSAGLIQIGKWIRTLRRWGVREATLAGYVVKQRMYDPLVWFRHRPDLRAARIWFHATRYDKRNDTVLAALCDELQREGITMIDSTQYIPALLADAGQMTSTQPSAANQADIDFALPILQRLGDLDIGQSIAVKDRDIIAVEAIEGTAAMIQRAGSLCRRGRWTLLKIAKPHQDMRFDVPTVGLETIDQLKAAGAACLAVQARKVILLDKPQLIEAADRAHIALLGLDLDQ